MNTRGWFLGMVLGLVVAGGTIVLFEWAIWGLGIVPDYMVVVALVWGIVCGVTLSLWGEAHL